MLSQALPLLLLRRTNDLAIEVLLEYYQNHLHRSPLTASICKRFVKSHARTFIVRDKTYTGKVRQIQ